MLVAAEAEKKERTSRFLELAFGLLDICAVLLLFLPFFGERVDGVVQSTALPALSSRLYLKILYYFAVLGTASVGILTLACQRIENAAWLKAKTPISLTFGAFSALVFIISSQVYAAAFAFVLLLVKFIIMIRSVSSL